MVGTIIETSPAAGGDDVDLGVAEEQKGAANSASPPRGREEGHPKERSDLEHHRRQDHGREGKTDHRREATSTRRRSASWPTHDGRPEAQRPTSISMAPAMARNLD